jgi:CheY-like chemotaxis protein
LHCSDRERAKAVDESARHSVCLRERGMAANVLVVDDNADFSKMLVRLLQRLGYSACCLASGPETITYLQTHQPDLLILDLMMPDMDGLDVLRQVRANPRLCNLPVIMFSAIVDMEIRQRVISAGATDWWVKAAVDYSRLGEKLKPYLAVNQAKNPESVSSG